MKGCVENWGSPGWGQHSRRWLWVGLVGMSLGFGLAGLAYYGALVWRRHALAVPLVPIAPGAYARLGQPQVRLRPGYYSISALGAPLWLDVQAGTNGVATKVSLVRAAPPGHRAMLFRYTPRGAFGLPECGILTGVGDRLGVARNVGLRQHFFFMSYSGLRTKSAVTYVFLHGRWVGNVTWKGRATILFHGKGYEYDSDSGNWAELSSSAHRKR